MRYALACLIAAAASPAFGQASVIPTPSQQASQAFTTVERQAPRFSDDYVDRQSDSSDADTIRRAGDWGQCVVAGARAASRTYLASLQTTARLRWTFDRCRRKVGDFDLFTSAAIRRAAISDALRAQAS